MKNDRNKEIKAGGTLREMVDLLAAGLCQIQEHIDKGETVQYPFPDNLVREFNIAAALNFLNDTDTTNLKG